VLASAAYCQPKALPRSRKNVETRRGIRVLQAKVMATSIETDVLAICPGLESFQDRARENYFTA
jgi:hypothetical protein